MNSEEFSKKDSLLFAIKGLMRSASADMGPTRKAQLALICRDAGIKDWRTAQADDADASSVQALQDCLKKLKRIRG